MKIKVAQCWDDGVLNDIRLTELLRKYNAKATFNLNPARHKAKSRITDQWNFNGYITGRLAWNEIKDVYDGFEVASHTMYHCNAGEVDDKVFLTQAVGAKVILEDMFQKPCKGFAWPCGYYTPETMKLLREAGFLYGRTCVNVDNVLLCEDTMALHSNCHALNKNFWDIFEKAKESGVFYFWGHSYELMDNAQLWSEFEEKIKRLSEDPNVEWINVVDIVDLCKKG